MQNFRHLSGVSTLQFNSEVCTGCGMCEAVCPHRVFRLNDRLAHVVDRDGCMECGACANNCPAGAIRVTPGVGCAFYIVQSWIKGKEAARCGGPECC